MAALPWARSTLTSLRLKDPNSSLKTDNVVALVAAAQNNLTQLHVPELSGDLLRGIANKCVQRDGKSIITSLRSSSHSWQHIRPEGLQLLPASYPELKRLVVSTRFNPSVPFEFPRLASLRCLSIAFSEGYSGTARKVPKYGREPGARAAVSLRVSSAATKCLLAVLRGCAGLAALEVKFDKPWLGNKKERANFELAPISLLVGLLFQHDLDGGAAPWRCERLRSLRIRNLPFADDEARGSFLAQLKARAPLAKLHTLLLAHGRWGLLSDATMR